MNFPRRHLFGPKRAYFMTPKGEDWLAVQHRSEEGGEHTVLLEGDVLMPESKVRLSYSCGPKCKLCQETK